MHQVGLAGSARLAGVVFLGEFVGFLDQVEVVVGPVFAQLPHQLAEAGHREHVGRDLFTQRRHDGFYPSGSGKGAYREALCVSSLRDGGTGALARPALSAVESSNWAARAALPNTPRTGKVCTKQEIRRGSNSCEWSFGADWRGAAALARIRPSAHRAPCPS